MNRFFLIAGLAAIISGLYFIDLNYSSEKKASVYSAIPENSPFFFEISSVRPLSETNSFKEFLKSTQYDWLIVAEKLDSIISKYKKESKDFSGFSYVVTFRFSPENVLMPIFICNAGSRKERKIFENIIREYYSGIKPNFSTLDYYGKKVRIATVESIEVGCYCFTEGLLIVSANKFILGEALNQLKKISIESNESFARVKKSASLENDVALYINQKSISKLFEKYINEQPYVTRNEFGDTNSFNYKNLVAKFANLTG